MDLSCGFEETINNFYEITGEMLTLAKYLLILNHHSFLSGIILLSLCFSKKKKKKILGTSRVVQCLRLHAPNAGGPGSIPDQGTQSFMLQLRVCVPQLKLPHAATQAQHSQKKKKNHSGYYVGNGLCIEASNY